MAALGGQAAAAATGGKLTRAPACDPYAVNGGGPPRGNGAIAGQGGGGGMGGSGGPPHAQPRRRNRGDRHPNDPSQQPPRDIHDVNKDCFIIPQGNLERFLPDGITVSFLFVISYLENRSEKKNMMGRVPRPQNFSNRLSKWM